MSTQKVTGFYIPKLKYFNPNYEPLPWKLSPDDGESLSRLSTHKKKQKNKPKTTSPKTSPRSKSSSIKTSKTSPRSKSSSTKTSKTSPRSKSSSTKTSKKTYVSPKTSPRSAGSSDSSDSSPRSIGSPSFSPAKKKYKTTKTSPTSPISPIKSKISTTKRSVSPNKLKSVTKSSGSPKRVKSSTETNIIKKKLEIEGNEPKGKISNEKIRELINKFWEIQDEKITYRDLNKEDRAEMPKIRQYMKKKMLEKLKSIDVSKTNLGEETSKLMKDRDFLDVFIEVARKDEYEALMKNPYNKLFLEGLDEVGLDYYDEVYLGKDTSEGFYLDTLKDIKNKRRETNTKQKLPIKKKETDTKHKSPTRKKEEIDTKQKSPIKKNKEIDTKQKSPIKKAERKTKKEIENLINKYWDLRSGDIKTKDLTKEEIEEIPKIEKYVKKKIIEKLKSIDTKKYHLGSYTSSLIDDDVFLDIFADEATKDEYLALMSNVYSEQFAESLNDFGFNYYNAVYLGQGNEQEYYANLLKNKDKKLYSKLKKNW